MHLMGCAPCDVYVLNALYIGLNALTWPPQCPFAGRSLFYKMDAKEAGMNFTEYETALYPLFPVPGPVTLKSNLKFFTPRPFF